MHALAEPTADQAPAIPPAHVHSSSSAPRRTRCSGPSPSPSSRWYYYRSSVESDWQPGSPYAFKLGDQVAIEGTILEAEPGRHGHDVPRHVGRGRRGRRPHPDDLEIEETAPGCPSSPRCTMSSPTSGRLSRSPVAGRGSHRASRRSSRRGSPWAAAKQQPDRAPSQRSRERLPPRASLADRSAGGGRIARRTPSAAGGLAARP